MKRELRTISGAQLRAKNADKMGASGYAAVFDQVTELYSWGNYKLREVIKAGAFKRAIDEKQDVRCLLNHDSNLVLGRTKSDTLALKEDNHGLHFDCDFPETTYAKDTHAVMERGDIDQCSFGFSVTKQTWRQEKDGDVTIETREIEEVDLYDVSPVTFPAYEGTSCEARNLFPDGIPEEVRSRMKGKPEGTPEHRDDSCECDCDECQEGNCAGCTEPECSDPNCEGHERSAKPPEQRLTKTVDGVELTADSFAVVGGVKDTRTWKLVIAVTDDVEKTKVAVRNAIARFNQTKIADELREAAWAKIVAAAQQAEVTVTEENRQKWNLTEKQFRDLTTKPEPPVDNEREAIEARKRLLEIELTL